MTWYADLGPCDYFGPEHAEGLRAVGWLEGARPFTTGDVDEAVLRRLKELSKEPWSPGASVGSHGCDLCRFVPEAFGSSNLFIPGNGFLYGCPELVSHYMNAHGYAPPGEFCDAVLACPDMRTMEYRKAILANGAGSLMQVGKRE